MLSRIFYVGEIFTIIVEKNQLSARKIRKIRKIRISHVHH